MVTIRMNLPCVVVSSSLLLSCFSPCCCFLLCASFGLLRAVRVAADVGWLKTVDQYFYGANNTIQHANVNSILTAMAAQLLENPDRKFIFVEQAFFQRWWDEQSKDKKDQVKDLVKSGQLEFINGGYTDVC